MTLRLLTSLATAALLTLSATGAQAQFPATDLPILTYPDDGTRGTVAKTKVCLICPKPAK